jgi:hypothetical protein
MGADPTLVPMGWDKDGAPRFVVVRAKGKRGSFDFPTPSDIDPSLVTPVRSG